MPRKPNPKPTSPDQLLRISFMLDLDRSPDFAFLKEFRGHGDRPRELVRLARLGMQLEQQRNLILSHSMQADHIAIGIAQQQRPPIPVAPKPTEVHNDPLLSPLISPKQAKDMGIGKNTPGTSISREDDLAPMDDLPLVKQVPARQSPPLAPQSDSKQNEVRASLGGMLG